MTKNAPGADIFSIVNERKPYEYEIVHPGTKRGMGFFITLQSINEEPVKKVTRAIQTEANKLGRKNQSFTAEQQRQNSIRIITAAITGWRFDLDADGQMGSAGGEQIEFNPANVRKVLEIDEIRDQLDGELVDTTNFFQN